MQIVLSNANTLETANIIKYDARKTCLWASEQNFYYIYLIEQYSENLSKS